MEYGHNHCNAWLSMQFLLCMCKHLGLTLILVTWQSAASIGCFTYFLKPKILSFHKKKYKWTNSKHAFFLLERKKKQYIYFFMLYAYGNIIFLKTDNLPQLVTSISYIWWETFYWLPSSGNFIRRFLLATLIDQAPLIFWLTGSSGIFNNQAHLVLWWTKLILYFDW